LRRCVAMHHCHGLIHPQVPAIRRALEHASRAFSNISRYLVSASIRAASVRLRFVASRKTITAPTTSPVRKRIGATESSSGNKLPDFATKTASSGKGGCDFPSSPQPRLSLNSRQWRNDGSQYLAQWFAQRFFLPLASQSEDSCVGHDFCGPLLSQHR
jgi:hypothetical protein